MSGLKRLDVTPAVHEGEWTVRVQLDGAPAEACAFLSPSESKELSQRLFHLALEISEREGQPQVEPTVTQLRAELKKEKEKRQELARKIAPKDLLEAAKRAVRIAAGYEERREVTLEQDDEYRLALAWLEEFKA